MTEVEFVGHKVQEWAAKSEKARVTVEEAGFDIFGLNRLNDSEVKLLAKALKWAGWQRKRVTHGGGQIWFYIRPGGTNRINNRLLDGFSR